MCSIHRNLLVSHSVAGKQARLSISKCQVYYNFQSNLPGWLHFLYMQKISVFSPLWSVEKKFKIMQQWKFTIPVHPFGKSMHLLFHYELKVKQRGFFIMWRPPLLYFCCTIWSATGDQQKITCTMYWFHENITNHQ